MSAETIIKNAYEEVGTKVLTMKRSGSTYRVEIEVCGQRMKFFAVDPGKCNWQNKRRFEMSLREIERSARRRA